MFEKTINIHNIKDIMKEVRALAGVFLTTLDNPYDFFTHFDEWYAFDTSKGYNTCSYLARIANVSNEMSDAEQDQAMEDAIDEILRMNITGNYRKVYEKEDKRKKKQDEESEDEEIIEEE